MLKTKEVKQISVFTSDNIGDLVRCMDCGKVQLIKIGDIKCGNCKREHLSWYDINNPEWTVEDLKEAGFSLENKINA